MTRLLSNYFLKNIICILLLSFSVFVFSQNHKEQITQALITFETTDNPNDGIKNLLQLKSIVAQTSDSLQGYYYLNLGIAYGQLNRQIHRFGI
ncbi:hypothetical protein [Gelatiniphilus marinus]|uniref:Uncharacterized protein n=1 Tax=Gelatiniphilus marinus TaxID=1759464 RepID=A0ABW5JXP5_9FLAO